jgi:phenylacetate-CoA ligase
VFDAKSGTEMAVLRERFGIIQVLEDLLQLRKNLKMDESEIERFQSDGLQRIVNHAYETVPFYEKLFDEYGVDPTNIRCVSDLNRLPIVNKGMLAKVPFDEKVSRLFTREPIREFLTGGSTGEPFRIYVSKEAANKRTAHRLRIFFLHGCKIFDTKAIVAGMSGIVRTQWYHKLGIFRKVEVAFDSSMSDQARTIVRNKPDILEGYPSRLQLIAKYLGDNQIEVKTPKAIFVDSETLLPSVRKVIEKGFGVAATNVYDSYEFGYTAWECKNHKGLHINCDSQIVQIVKDNAEVEDGRRGNIIITDLDNYAMPLIRYDTGDIGAKSKNTCDCGIVFPLLESVLGRKWDVLLSPSGEEIPPLLVEQFVRKHEGVLEYQIVQNSLKTLNVDMVVSNDYDYSMDCHIQKQLGDLYGFKNVIINHPEHVRRTASGKLRCVVRNF